MHYISLLGSRVISLSGSIFAIEIRLRNEIPNGSMLAHFTEIGDFKNGSSMCESKTTRPFTFPKHEKFASIEPSFQTLHFLYRNFE